MVKDSKASKDLWKCIHSLNPSQQEKPYELLNEDGIKTNNVRDICNVFNKFFTSCVENLRTDRCMSKNNDYAKLNNFVQKKFTKSEQVCLADTSVKIVNGDNANIEDHPWMVHIQIRRNESANFTTFCGGVIIDKSWVLSAAHCNRFNVGGPAKNIRVAAGSSFLSQMKVIIPVKKYYVHEKFYLFAFENDIMLLQLQKPLKFGSTINKIDLDTDIGKNYTGDLCTVTGWDDTDLF
ncbi:unnamed protein product [Mytilus edulis]|uniref:Peptidase S1 domain-containing protein n=1 Tax=Mytilus edulis TaxID=6550 RepID=A0A8S3UZH5_MYTED|nr:unnamed protein product [Mytilus edulis]